MRNFLPWKTTAIKSVIWIWQRTKSKDQLTSRHMNTDRKGERWYSLMRRTWHHLFHKTHVYITSNTHIKYIVYVLWSLIIMQYFNLYFNYCSTSIIMQYFNTRLLKNWHTGIGNTSFKLMHKPLLYWVDVFNQISTIHHKKISFQRSRNGWKNLIIIFLEFHIPVRYWNKSKEYMCDIEIKEKMIYAILKWETVHGISTRVPGWEEKNKQTYSRETRYIYSI